MSDLHYNLEPLNNLVDGNLQFQRTLIELFNQTTPPILQDIQDNYLKKDWKGLYLHLHKIKPTIDSMGIHVAKPYLQAVMQEVVKEKDSVELEKQITQFCNIILETIEQLKTNEL